MDDLWPGDLIESNVKAPVTFLREQASLLAEKTNSLLYAEVRQITFPDPSGFEYAFEIVAPGLQDYRYELFRISYDVNLYPVNFHLEEAIKREVHGGPPVLYVQAPDEPKFLEILSKVLTSQKTRQVVSALRAQLT